jgi:hypothetical protein
MNERRLNPAKTMRKFISLDQPGADGYPEDADDVKREGYGKIPVPHKGEFQDETGGYSVPHFVHGWQWSQTFGRWGALVTFPSGWHGFTYPRIDYSATFTDA